MYITEVVLKWLIISTHFSLTAETLHLVFFMNLVIQQES